MEEIPALFDNCYVTAFKQHMYAQFAYYFFINEKKQLHDLFLICINVRCAETVPLEI